MFKAPLKRFSQGCQVFITLPFRQKFAPFKGIFTHSNPRFPKVRDSHQALLSPGKSFKYLLPVV